MSMNIDRNKVKVLSLFDGMACGMLAMNRAGVTVDRYVAYEIDSYAIKTAAHNFPNIEHKGDVFDADFNQYVGFDFVIGGSPCTHWSIAQTKNRETEASGIGWELFSQFNRAINTVKPSFFIYENNKSMSNTIRDSITNAFGFEPICINSALMSGQNRQRLYWVGRRNKRGAYDKVDVKQPEDMGVLLKHLLDDNSIVERDKGYCLKHQAGNARDYFKKRHTNVKFEPVNHTKDGKSQTIKAQYTNTNEQNICCFKSTYGASGVAEPVDFVQKIGVMPNSSGEQLNSQANRIYSVSAKGDALCGNAGGSGGKTGLYAIPCEVVNGEPIKATSASDGKQYRVYRVGDKTISIKGKQYPINLDDGYYIIRKLSVNECKRLQTVPEWYEFPVSDTQAYKMLGNGWTVNVISYIIDACLNEIDSVV